MNRHVRSLKLALVLALFAALTACFWERFSWSPDGRWLIFPSDQKNEIWRWDSQTHQTEAMSFKARRTDRTDIGFVQGCHYLPAGDKILLATQAAEDESGPSDHTSLWLADLNEQNQSTLITTGSAALYYDVAPDGRVLYVEEREKKKRYDMMVFKDDRRTTLHTFEKEIGFPRLAPGGRRVLYVGENSLELLELDRQTTRTLLAGAKQQFYWPAWVDDGHVLFYHLNEDHDKDFGALMMLALDDGTTRTVCERVWVYDPPSFSADRARVAVFAMRPGAGDRDAGALMMDRQAAAVDLKTGAMTWLTSDDLSAGSPTFSPDGRRLAYGSVGQVYVLDLAAGRRTVAVRDEYDRLWGAADTLVQTGEAVQALGVLRELLARLPEDASGKLGDKVKPLRQAALYRMAMLYLQPPLEDADKAYEFIKKLEIEELRTQALARFWRPSDRVATDPAGDWITTWNTPEAEKAWGENTDLARDLRALWVRLGKERAYVRVDYASGKDLSGIALQDTVMLFDTRPEERPDGPDGGAQTRVGVNGAWDRPASAQVIIRHWFPEGAQYDVEVRFAKDDANLRFLGAGFAPAEGSSVEWMGTTGGKTPGVSWALSRKRLNLEGNDLGIQVVTLKGGIGVDKLKEKPLGEGSNVADAFGLENIAAKVKGAAAQGQGAAVCVIKGYAGVVKMK